MLITSPSILITDDDTDFRETVRDVFEHQGFRTLTAGDGEEALSIVRNDDVHLVLLDMHMPKLTGLETLRQLKRIRTPLPCILLSAALDDALIRQAQFEEAFSVLSKPISGRQLTLAVQLAMQRTYNWPSAAI